MLYLNRVRAIAPSLFRLVNGSCYNFHHAVGSEGGGRGILTLCMPNSSQSSIFNACLTVSRIVLPPGRNQFYWSAVPGVSAKASSTTPLPPLQPPPSYLILSYLILSCPILSYAILPALSYILLHPILSCPVLSYPIMSSPIRFYPIHRVCHLVNRPFLYPPLRCAARGRQS